MRGTSWLIFNPCEQRPTGREPRTEIHAGGGQSHRLVAATAKGQLQRRLVGLVSDRPEETLLICADNCNIVRRNSRRATYSSEVYWQLWVNSEALRASPWPEIHLSLDLARRYAYAHITVGRAVRSRSRSRGPRSRMGREPRRRRGRRALRRDG